MRPRYQPPNKRQYFHTKPKLDKRDLNYLKFRIQNIKQKKLNEKNKFKFNYKKRGNIF